MPTTMDAAGRPIIHRLTCAGAVHVTDCPGACNAAHRATGQGEPIPGEPVWCRPDQARIRRQLAELDDIAALVAMTADGHREQGTEPSRGNGHAPSPSPSADDINLLWHTLADWEDAYRDLKNWPSPPRRGILATQLTTTIAWQLNHLDGMLAAPFAADYGTEIAQWHRRLSAAGKLGSGRRRGLVECPHCKLRMLYRAEGDDHWACASCGRWMSGEDYREEARLSLERAS